MKHTRTNLCGYVLTSTVSSSCRAVAATVRAGSTRDLDRALAIWMCSWYSVLGSLATGAAAPEEAANDGWGFRIQGGFYVSSVDGSVCVLELGVALPATAAVACNAVAAVKYKGGCISASCQTDSLLNEHRARVASKSIRQVLFSLFALYTLHGRSTSGGGVGGGINRRARVWRAPAVRTMFATASTQTLFSENVALLQSARHVR